MRRRFGVTGAKLGLLTVGLALVFAGGVSAAANQKKPPLRDAKDVSILNPDAKFVPGELLVRFKPAVDNGARTAVLAEHGAEVKKRLPVADLLLVKLPPGKSIPGVIAALKAKDEVVYAEPNWIYRATATPNDPRFTELWGLQSGADHDIDAPEAWDVTTGSASVVVAVIDTGIAWQHPDLAANIWTNSDETVNGVDDDGNGKIDDVRGWDFVNEDNDPFDDNEHGTHVAGTIGARGNNGVGVAGVNWNVKLMPLKFLSASGSGTTADAIQAILYARGEGARVVNNSWGGGGFSQALLDAFAGGTNTLFVNAAGNDGANNDGGPNYPCNYDASNIICVAATDSNDGLASFSNYGATTVDLGAPGVGILSTVPGAGFGSVWTEGWESDLTGRWLTGGSPNTWARTSAASSAGSFSATDSPGGSYANGTDNWIRTVSPVNLSGSSNCSVRYDLRLDSEIYYDFIEVEASTDGGTWTTLEGWSGSTGGEFYDMEATLGSFSGQPSVYLRFAFLSDSSIVSDGAYVDQVDVGCADPTAGAYASFNGTSMATPHVVGVAALAWAKNPGVSITDVKQAILNGGDPVASLSGKTVTGRRLNAAGTLALIPSPGPPQTFADVSPSHPFYSYIEQMYARGITTGCGRNAQGALLYCPSDNVSREAMAAFVVRAKGLTQLTPTTPTFSDVPSTHTFYGHIERFFEQGITTGCGRNAQGALLYCPSAKVTREAMAAFLIRAFPS